MVTTRRSKAAASSSSTSAASTKGDDSTSNTTDVDEMILGEASGRTHDHGHDPPELPAAQSNPTKRRRVKSATKPKVPARGNARKPKGGTAIVPGSTKDEAGVTSSSEGRPWYAQFTNGDTEYDEYMKTEWGFEKRGDDAMFEKLSLEGAQSGLSWLTILRKRGAYRKAFHSFDVDRVASMTADDVQAILDAVPMDRADARIVVVRHRGKVEAVINNARRIQEMRRSGDHSAGDHGVFDAFLWSFVDDKPILNTEWDGKLGLANAPGRSEQSLAMSNALKKLGFKFVGPTTCYSMMQSEGMVVDHPVGSLEWKAALRRLQDRPGGYQRAGKK